MTILNAERPKIVEISVAEGQQRGRLLYADMLRAWAIVQVLYVHCTSPYLPNLSNSGGWFACLIPEILGRASVPLFLMLSGMFLLQKEFSSPREFLFKRMGRILIPLAIWSGIYLLWGHYTKGEALTPERCLNLFSTPAYYHLGYLYFLTGLYLAAPLLKVFTKAATAKDYIYFIALWMFSSAVVPALKKFAGIEFSIQLVVATHLTGYFILGHALKDYVVTKAGAANLWVIGISSCVLSGAVTYFLTAANEGRFDPFFLESSSALIFFYSAATFLLFKSFSFKTLKAHPKVLKVCTSIGDSAFTMYLLHPIVLDICLKTKLVGFIHKSGFGWTSLKVFLLASTVTITTWLFVVIARRLKVPHWLIP